MRNSASRSRKRTNFSTDSEESRHSYGNSESSAKINILDFTRGKMKKLRSEAKSNRQKSESARTLVDGFNSETTKFINLLNKVNSRAMQSNHSESRLRRLLKSNKDFQEAAHSRRMAEITKKFSNKAFGIN